MPVVFETRCKCGKIFSSTREWALHYAQGPNVVGACGFLFGGQKWIEGPGERRFHKSSYWGRWSRVLEEGFDIWEVNLDAIDGIGWDTDVAPVVIRCHGTARKPQDISTAELPAEVVSKMVANLPAETVGLLLGDGLREQIDFDLYRRLDRAGHQKITLAEVRKR